MNPEAQYDLYDDGKLVSRGIAGEIAEKLGCTRNTLVAYAREEKAYKKRYTFRKVEYPVNREPGKEMLNWRENKRSELKGDHIIVHGKGEKDRTVYLNAKAQIELQKYLDERTDAYDWIFPKGIGASQTMKTKSKKIRSIATRSDWYKFPELLVDDHTETGGIEALVRGIGKRAGVEDCHPHRFRRTCATMALRRGMPVEQVSQMLGHEQLSTTQIYLDLSEEDLMQAHRKYVV